MPGTDDFGNGNAILVASHPRSGTHLMIDLIRRQFPATKARRFYGLPLDHLYLNIERLTASERRFDEAKAHSILAKARRPIVKTHYLADFSETWVPEETNSLAPIWRALVDESCCIYVHRDPREVMVSLKQFLSKMNPAVAQASLPEFIRMEHWSGRTTMLGWWVEHVESWLERPGVLVLSYRRLLSDTEAIVREIAGYVNERPVRVEPLLPPKVNTVTRTRLDRLFSLAPASTAIIADARRHPAVHWNEVCSATDEEYLEATAGVLLERLGYSSQRTVG